MNDSECMADRTAERPQATASCSVHVRNFARIASKMKICTALPAGRKNNQGLETVWTLQRSPLLRTLSCQVSIIILLNITPLAGLCLPATRLALTQARLHEDQILIATSQSSKRILAGEGAYGKNQTI
ncbi:hypothetical protein PM082_021439 [Marasmius tenuissimus]|nr:hypothetical protein PM082_021439 [Marasmius tenuissimus]